MKFGKNIRREMLNNRSLHYLNYKYLKKLIKHIHIKSTGDQLEEAFELNQQFQNVLQNDLSIIEATFQKMFNEMIEIQVEIEKHFKTELVADVKKIEKNISFDELLNILKEKNVSKEFFDFCIQLSMLSNKCKILRTYVIYNYIGLIKILKKKRKHCDSMFDTLLVSDVVNKYSWCLSEELPKLISSVNIICDEFMQNFVEGVVTVEKYSCPICLHLINEPVVLSSCFHSFCWNCLATAIQKYSMDCCPICRTKIFYDKNSIQVDGILCRFLNKYFMTMEGSSSMNSILFDETTSLCFSPQALKEHEVSYKKKIMEKKDNSEESVNILKNDDCTCESIKECKENNLNGIRKLLCTQDSDDAHEQENNILEHMICNKDMKHRIQYNNKKGNDMMSETDFYFMNMKTENSFFKYDESKVLEESGSLDNLNEYLSVLNKNDSNSNEDKEKESDYSSDDLRVDDPYEPKNNISSTKHKVGNFRGKNLMNPIYTYSSELTNSDKINENSNTNDNYNIINNVISYTLN